MDFTDVVTPVLRHAAQRPHHAAFVFGDRAITYRDLVEQSRQAATFLKDHGLGKGDRVAVMSQNRPEIFTIYLGLAMLGAAIVPINADLGPNEIRYILDHSDARMIVRPTTLAGVVAEALTDRQKHISMQDMEELIASASALAPYEGPQLGSGQDLVLLCYTSGTTAKPKGVAATHGNELASAFAYQGMMAITHRDTVLVALPLTFSFGFHAATYVALMSGATVLLTDKFHPKRTLEVIDARRPTVFMGVPTMYAMMADVAKSADRKFDASSLRLAAASGAAVNEQLVADCEEHLGLKLRAYYAMTEVRPIFSFDLRCEMQPPRGSVGRLIEPTEVRLVDEGGKVVREGEVGELWVRGPSFSGAYYKDPHRTAEAVVDGWFRTLDLASRDREGNYFIVGRTRDQIISGGAKIAPIEVEEALLSHPGVAAAAVVGAPDTTFGQIVKAVVVKSDPSLSEEDLKAHCAARIAEYKVPRIVAFRDALPIAPSGKVLKSALI